MAKKPMFIEDLDCKHEDYFVEIIGSLRTGDVICRRCGFTWNPKSMPKDRK